jgi:pimeloyl-ACP methyl ester carboxylesterase
MMRVPMTTDLTVTRDVLTLPDGRRLEWSVCGPASGTVVLHHHIQPGSAEPQRSWARAAVARGLRFVTPARPGYGRSDRHAGRTVASFAADCGALLDALGAEKAFVSSASGGGPYALACGARLRGRVRGLAITASPGPGGEPAFDYVAGRQAANLGEYNAALAGEATLRAYLDVARPGMLAGCADPEALRAHLAKTLPAVDSASLSGELAADVARGMIDALAKSADGWVDDDLAGIKPWGFEFQDLAGIPVSLWHGEDDATIPIAHARWLAKQIPGARTHFLAGEAHISIGQNHLDEIFDELVS